MRVYISPSKPQGSIDVISSKSMLHRLLICSSFCNHATNIICNNDSDDIRATIDCLEKLGAQITRIDSGYRVVPVPHDIDNPKFYQPRKDQRLYARQSGTTLRFMVAILAALNAPNTIDAHEQLKTRPITDFIEELTVAGAHINLDGTYPLSIDGSMRAGTFILPGNISSQYISALLLAAPLMEGISKIQVTKPFESSSYVQLTIEAMEMFGVKTHKQETDTSVVFTVEDSQYVTPGEVVCEGDWSQASMWLALGALSDDTIGVRGLNMTSAQPDRAILGALSIMGARVLRRPNEVYVRKDQVRPLSIDCSQTPDLVPALALLASSIPSTTKLTGLERLKYKESDRILAVSYTLRSFGIDCEADESSLTITGGNIRAPKFVLDPHDDHRICMLQALMATQADGVCAIENAQVVDKSYPEFYQDMLELDLAIKLED